MAKKLTVNFVTSYKETGGNTLEIKYARLNFYKRVCIGVNKASKKATITLTDRQMKKLLAKQNKGKEEALYYLSWRVIPYIAL